MLSTRGREEPGCADGLGGVWAPAEDGWLGHQKTEEDGWLGHQKRMGGLGTRRSFKQFIFTKRQLIITINCDMNLKET